MSTEDKLLEDIASGKGLKPIQTETKTVTESNSKKQSHGSGIRFDRFSKQESHKENGQKDE